MNIWDQRSFEWPDLPPRALVVEVGGFEGRWAGEMMRRYPDCEMHIFEPAPWAVARLLQSLPRAAVNAYGLGVETGTFPMGGWETDSASFLKDDAFFAAHPEEGRNARGMGMMVEVGDAFERASPGRTIDLMMVNIEGYEFRLLPYMHARGLLGRVDRLAVQFHGALDRGGEEALVRSLLAETHDVLWDYVPLTAWRRR